MTYFNLEKDSLPTEISCDICIVGSGAAGIAIASRFVNNKLKVLLMESGEFKPVRETQNLYDLHNIGYPIRQDFMSRARYHGGTTNIWLGRSMMLSRIDFIDRNWVSDSGWPFGYNEILNYYNKAVKLLKLPKKENFQVNKWFSGMNKYEKLINYEQNICLNASIWGVRPFNFRREYFSTFKTSRYLDVYLNSNLVKITLNENKKHISKVDFTSLNGNSLVVKPKICVLACGGLENPRLLLNSRHQINCGLGNENDLVGRYYSDHPRSIMGTIELNRNSRLPLFVGYPFSDGKIQLGIQFSEDTQKSDKLLNNYLSLEPVVPDIVEESYDSIIRLGKRFFRRGYSDKRLNFSTSIAHIPEIIYYLTPKELLPHKLYSFIFPFLKYSKSLSGSYKLRVANYCEQAPNSNSRVFLGKDKCRLGLNKIILDWRVGQDEKRNVLKLQSFVESCLRKNNIGKLCRNSSDIKFTDASHHIGTTRMSHDSKKGVVDSNCKIHNIDNLYIAGSSVFPTAGHANPTLTIVALSLKLADEIKRTFGLV